MRVESSESMETVSEPLFRMVRRSRWCLIRVRGGGGYVEMLGVMIIEREERWRMEVWVWSFKTLREVEADADTRETLKVGGSCSVSVDLWRAAGGVKPPR